ncbi:ankyrin repeat domain-containing protein 53-like [Protopterus annectens]|uniref:ankyrin repeat domain-containing protein 53-like n=1 Tax=Protopterus annectens TaxID=7888 RepID=UPI001CF93622|nr:ankyrin repeat domain-containing protein 53-like [Protopterus annectens]XP_043920003.1 ankyrin repeat domain-containing protein 53-like [Protopterus annectens]
MSSSFPKRRVLQKLKTESDELMAAAVGDLAWLRQSLQKAKSVTHTDKHGLTVIHLAALHGHLECLKELIEKYNVDIDLASSEGWRPIHLVLNKECGPNAMSCLKYLIEKKANVNVKTEAGLTPLHQAASEGLLDCIMALAEAGADVHVKDQDGHRPIDYCRLWGHRRCARYLKDRMWKKGKEEFLHQLQQLSKMKCQLILEELAVKEKYQADNDFFGQLAFSDWIDGKNLPEKLKKAPLCKKKKLSSRGCLPNKLNTFHTVEKKQKTKKVIQNFEKDTVETTLQAESSVSQRECKITRDQKHKKDRINKIAADKSCECASTEQPKSHMSEDEIPTQAYKQPWNISVNPCAPPVTSIYRPTVIQPGMDGEDYLRDHDFKDFLLLSKDKLGNPKVRTVSGGRASPLPLLPFEVLKNKLFPSSLPDRIKVPEDFKSVCILDVPRKRLPRNGENPWSEITFHLREKLDGGLEVCSPVPTTVSSNSSLNSCISKVSS